MNPKPPELPARLLTLRLSPQWRDYVLGDLEEEFRARAERSPRAARTWYWRQALRCLIAPPRPSTATLQIPKREPFMRTLLPDFRYAFRVLLRTPSFTVAVIAVLALGIGANTAIFSIVNAVLLRPLPFERSDRLMRLFHIPPQDTFPGLPTFSVSPANFYDWQRSATQFEGMAIYRFRPFVLTGGANAQEILAAAVGAGFFEIVRARPAMGRVFLPEEDAQGRHRVVIISDGFWKRYFGSAPDVVGRTLRLDGDAYEVVGVMPPWFSNEAWGATAQDLWVPLAYTDKQRAVRENHNAQVVARLRDGASLSQANLEMEQISKRLEVAYPADNAGWGATVIPLHELIVGNVRTSLVVVLGAVGLVLLIACANVGNLLFTRALTRRKEIAIRSALGAGRARVFQQLLVESMLLAAAGGVVGVLLARLTLQSTATLLAAQLPRADEVSMDGYVLLFAFGVSLVTGILAGVTPALRAGRADLNEALKEGGRNESTVGVRTRRALIVCEVALSLVLLMSAGVMIRSLLMLRNTDAGFNPRNVLTLRAAPPEGRYNTPEKYLAFFDAALARVRALPGVEVAGAIDTLPTQGGSQQYIVVEGRPELSPRDQPSVAVRRITPGYLKAMQIPLLRGRDVADSDTEVILLGRSAAKMLWGEEDPIGRRVMLPLESRTVYRQVIGIIGDVRQESLSEPATPTVYEFTRSQPFGIESIVMRTAVPPMTLAAQATEAIRAVDREQPVEDVRTLQAVLDETLGSQRFSALLLGLFAAVAVTLASVGIYSVLSYIVRGRSRELGIRTALGARTSDVIRLVVVEGMTPTLIGIVAGVGASLWAGKLLQKLVYGVSAWDPLTLTGVAVGLTVVAFVATLVPAYRASRVDPLIVLRG